MRRIFQVPRPTIRIPACDKHRAACLESALLSQHAGTEHENGQRGPADLYLGWNLIRRELVGEIGRLLC